MVKTRLQTGALKRKRENRRSKRENIPENARQARLKIVKDIAKEIVCTQQQFGVKNFGCRKKIIDRYKHIYSWLETNTINWHVIQYRKLIEEGDSTKNDTSLNLISTSTSTNSQAVDPESSNRVCENVSTS